MPKPRNVSCLHELAWGVAVASRAALYLQGPFHPLTNNSAGRQDRTKMAHLEISRKPGKSRYSLVEPSHLRVKKNTSTQWFPQASTRAIANHRGHL
jgi:hypothetical protein